MPIAPDVPPPSPSIASLLQRIEYLELALVRLLSIVKKQGEANDKICRALENLTEIVSEQTGAAKGPTTQEKR